MRITTAGGVVVASGDNSAFLAAQVRGLVARGYPAFARNSGQVAEIVRREGRWQVEGTATPMGVGLIVNILNETEPTEGAEP